MARVLARAVVRAVTVMGGGGKGGGVGSGGGIGGTVDLLLNLEAAQQRRSILLSDEQNLLLKEMKKGSA